jgi:hypothetical protein
VYVLVVLFVCYSYVLSLRNIIALIFLHTSFHQLSFSDFFTFKSYGCAHKKVKIIDFLFDTDFVLLIFEYFHSDCS